MSSTNPSYKHQTNSLFWKDISFFAFLLIYQLFFIFTGVDFLDEGFLASFYDQLFTTPQLHTYNFAFWLDGIIGALWMKSFPGIHNLRIAGIIVTTLTAIVVVWRLKQTLGRRVLFSSVFLIVLSMNNDVKAISYNNLSALFYTCAILFLIHGLAKDKLTSVFACGAILGLSIFLRTPNITSVSLAIVIPFYAHSKRSCKTRNWIRQLLILLLGFLVSVSITIITMQILGHWKIYQDSLKMLISMGKGDPGLHAHESNYSIEKIFRQTISNNIQSVKIFMLCATLTLLPLGIKRLLPKNLPQRKEISYFLSIIFGLVLGIYIAMDPTSKYFLIHFFSGISLLSIFVFFRKSESPETKALLLAGIIFMVTYPIGSSAGIYTAGRYALWIALPIALHAITRIEKIQLTIQQLESPNEKISLHANTDIESKRIILYFFLPLILWIGIFFAYRYPMFDNYDRFSMKGKIDNRKMRFVKTTSEKAGIINETLAEIKRITKPGDTTLIYDCMPLLHYLTETVPYLNNSHPILYEPIAFKRQLDKSESDYKSLPVVIRQNFFPMGYDVKWPDEDNLAKYPIWEKNRQRNAYMNEFIENHDYKLYWSNRYFDILIPPKEVNRNGN